MAATVKLPHITHPAHRRCSTDTEALQLRGSKLSDAEKTTTGAARKKFTRSQFFTYIYLVIMLCHSHNYICIVRPTSVPTHLKLRPQSAELSSNQVYVIYYNYI